MPVRGETLIFVCFYGCVEFPLKTGLCKLNGRSGRRHAGAHAPAGHTLLTGLQMEKKYVFRNPRDAI